MDVKGRGPAVRPEATPDEELMARVRDGEVALLSELFERHNRRLYHYFLRATGGRAAAEDLVQEVFVRLLKYRHTYRDGAPFAPWLWTSARNAATDHYRGRPAELPQFEDEPEPATAEPSPLAELEGAEARRRLRSALDALAPEKREVLLLARFSDLKYQRIGELLGISEGAVKLRVHRAMKDLKSAFLAGAEGGLA